MSDNALDAVHFGMGTEMAHRACGENAAEALKAVEEEAKRLERLLSRFIPESDIGRINAGAGRKPATISLETLKILELAAGVSLSSRGCFDVTVAPLADLWDYKNAVKPPEAERIREILSLVGWRDLELDVAEGSAGLKREGQSIDLGGIAKGYASDRFMQIFRERGVASAFSNIGGNVSTLGSKPDGSAWRVGIRHPRAEDLMGVVEASGEAVVTSGDYERYFTDDAGKRYHHILDPKTGYPAESGLISVTVVAGSAMLADALSTAVFVAGLERGAEILKKYLQAEAVLIDEKLRVYVTRGLKGRFESASGIALKYI